MNVERESLVRFGDVLADIGHEFRPHDCGRYEVRRTRNDEERQPIPGWKRRLIYKRDHYRCVWCGWHKNLQLDHITPWSAGGSDGIDNLRTLCRKCNGWRSNRGYSMDLDARHLPHGEECVDCAPGKVLGHPLTEPIFCTYCEHHAVGLAASYGYTAYFRRHATLDELNEIYWDHQALGGVS